MVKKLSDLYLDTRRALLAVEDKQSAGHIARHLVAHFAGKTQEEFLRDWDHYAGDDICANTQSAVERLLGGEPLAYVLGQWEFYGLNLFVNEHVLIPRDDTVAVATLAINRAMFLPENPRVLDLCTGSGCIGLAVASRIKDARVTLADISRDALAVAKKNMLNLKLAGRVNCIQADALKPAPAVLGKFDMIVSNPPYITGEEMKELPHSVADFEPHLALWGGDDGLDFYRSIAENYTRALKPGGFLCLEYDPSQGDDICAILETHGYKILERAKDYNDRERAVLAPYGGKDD